MTEAIKRNREAWLEAAIDIFRARFKEIEYPLPDQIHVSVGFGYGSKRESSVILGQCWARSASDDEVNHLFISPEVSDTGDVLAVLLHELIHAADDLEHGHRGVFADIAEMFGFEKPITQNNPGPALQAEMFTIAESLGAYPHGALHPVRVTEKVPVGPDGQPLPKLHSGPPKQGTRMLKVVCGTCGYTARTTHKWVEKGLPFCPDMDRMELAE